ncbi:MAG: D-alanyl-D-alanine carboxypeptidase family protein [Xanthobacteraceae bacterium]|nr:D-alanyl-D-alanine carboxypeptidase family protein [Xanthobacteraceae bacterium]
MPAAAGPYLLIDADSGKVISQSKAGQPWYPASVTKLMTTYLAFRALREGRLQPDTLITFSENALAQAPSKMGFPLGTQVTIDNAIKMLLVKSANDVAVVLAEGVGGSLPNFIEEMNQAADRLGMTATHFVNPNGLPEENQYTTARDMAVLARAIIREFPEYEMYFRIPAIQIGKRLLRNHNKLIDHYPGADGMKTGFICASGFNLVASARRGDKRLIAVVFGAYSSGQRNEDAARLFEKGFGAGISLAGLFGREPTMLESIPNIADVPIDLHDQMCNRKRKRPAAESDIDEEEPEDAPPGTLAKAAALVKKPLLIDLPPSMPPIKVYIGSAQQQLEPKDAAAPKKAPKAPKAAKGKGARPASVDSASPQVAPAVAAPADSTAKQVASAIFDPPPAIHGTIKPAPLDTMKVNPAPTESSAIPRTAQAFTAHADHAADDVFAPPPGAPAGIGGPLPMPAHVPLPRPRPRI